MIQLEHEERYIYGVDARTDALSCMPSPHALLPELYCTGMYTSKPRPLPVVPEPQINP